LGFGSTTGKRLLSEADTLIAYKPVWGACMRVLRLNRSKLVKIVVEFQFEAVLGKTRRTEF